MDKNEKRETIKLRLFAILIIAIFLGSSFIMVNNEKESSINNISRLKHFH
jgi:thioredoxin-related protein